MKYRLLLVLPFLFTTMVTFALDFPHTLANPTISITCLKCHDLKAGFDNLLSIESSDDPVNIDDTPANNLCWSCHNNAVAPYRVAHSSYRTSNRLGTWNIECKTCHNPHYQPQIKTYESDAHLFSGVIDSIDATTLTDNEAIWAADEHAGRVVFPDINAKNRRNRPVGDLSYRVLSNTTTTLTLDVDATKPLTGVSYFAAGDTFAIVYGKLIRDKLQTPNSGQKTVKFFAPTGANSFADSDSTLDGVCQVCHTKVGHFRNDGSAPDQMHLNAGGTAGQECTEMCHLHTNGFAHFDNVSSGWDATVCIECHGHEAGTFYMVDAQYPYDPSNSSRLSTTPSGGFGSTAPHATHTESWQTSGAGWGKTTPDSAGADDRRGPGIYCSVCHDITEMPSFKSGADLDGDGIFSLAETDVCDDCHSPGGTYNGVNSTNGSIGAKDSWHTEGVYNADGTLKAGKEFWCAGCHDEDPSRIVLADRGIDITAPKVIGDESADFKYGTGWGFYKTGHGVPNSTTIPASGGAKDGPGKGCPDCHDTSLAHIDGLHRTFDCSDGCTPAEYRESYRLQLVDGQLPMEVPNLSNGGGGGMGGGGGGDPASFRLCLNSGCHADTADSIVNGGSDTNFPKHALHVGIGGNIFSADWGTGYNGGVSCVLCHNPHGTTNLAMIRDGQLTSRPSFEIWYTGAPNGGSRTTPPDPDNVTLSASTAILMVSQTVRPYCARNCHMMGNTILLGRTPFQDTDKTPILSWVSASGFDNDGVNPDAAVTGSSFTFQVQYKDYDNDAPSSIDLWVDANDNGTYEDPGERHALQMAGAFPGYYINGLDYTTSITLSQAGDNIIKYKFTATDADGTATGGPTNDSTLRILDTSGSGGVAPTLDWTGEPEYNSDGVNPDSGSAGGTFEFRVRYTDPEGVAPAIMELWIDENGNGAFEAGEKYAMTAVGGDGDYSNGEHYTKTLVLYNAGGGYIDYRFSASDGFSDAGGSPASLSKVLVSNGSPVLDWPGDANYVDDGVDPNIGGSGSSFTFRVKYTDVENTAPPVKQIWIDKNDNFSYEASERYVMAAEGGGGQYGDGVYSNGEYYTRSVTLTAAGDGRLRYRFEFTDGTYEAVGEPASLQYAKERYSRYVYVTIGETTVGTVSATAAGTSSINVSMPYTNDGNGDNTYTVDFKLSSSGSWSNWVTAAAHTSSPYTTSITGLTPGESYDVRMTFADPDGINGTNPQTVSGVTLPVVPIATIAGTATAAAVGSTSISVSMPYSDDIDGDNTYTVDYKLSASGSWINWVTNAAHTASPYTTTITGLAPGEIYDVKVTYNDADGVGGANPQTLSNIVMPLGPGATVTGVATAVSGGNGQSIDVAMPYSSDVDGDNTYTVDYKLSAAGSWINWVTNAAHTASPYTTTITGLTLGESYDVRLTFNDADGVNGTNPQMVNGITLVEGPITVCAQGSCDFTGIQMAIDDASTIDGDTILVSDGTYSENINFRSKNITVKSENGGAVTLIDGSGSDAPVVTFNSASLTASAILDGFTINNQTDGGSLRRGIYITNSATPTIKNSIVKGNKPNATVDGAGIFIDGGGATIEATTVGDIADTNTGDLGAGLYALNTTETISISDSTFNYNSGSNGAAIHLSGVSLATVITSTAITNNTASQHGGGIYGDNSQLTLTSSYVDDNTSGSSFDGGGLYLTGASAGATISASSFIGNQGRNGAGIYANGTGAITISNGSGVNSNTGTASGAGIYMLNTIGASAISDSIVSDNSGTASGAGIYFSSTATATLELTNVKVDNNTVTDTTNYDGGGLYLSGANVSVAVTGGTINGNSTRSGGAIFANGGLNLIVADGVAMDGNTATANGGGIAISDASSTLSASKCYIRGNSAPEGGGGIYLGSGTTSDITNCTITGNTTDMDNRYGGGISNSGTLTLYNTTISGNYVFRSGGGLYANGTETIRNTIIWGNVTGNTDAAITGSADDVQESDIEGGHAGTGNLNIDPLFVNMQQASNGTPTTAGDFHIQTGSPVIDQGTATGAPVDDIDNDPRPQGVGIDMGSDERLGGGGSGTSTLHPSGSSTGDNVGYTGGTAATAMDSNDGDTSYGSASGISNDFYLEIDDTAQTASIDSVQVFVVARDSGMGTANFTIGLKTNGSSYFSDDKFTSNSYAIYPGDIYTTNPQTGVGWTWTEINNLVAIINHTDNTTLRVTELYVEINYSTDSTPPAAVSNLATNSPSNDSIDLTWTAPGDDGNTGTATTYDIRYSTSIITEGNWASATQAAGEPSPSVAGSGESFTVAGLNPGTAYYFAIKTTDNANNISTLSNVPSATTGAGGGPGALALHPSGAAAGDNVSYSGGAAAIALDTDDGDTSYGSSSGSSNDFYLEIDDTAQTGTIDSVQVLIVARDSGMGTAVFTIGLKTNGSNYFSGGQSTSGSYDPYSGDIYTTNPQTGSPWTWAEINNLVAIVNHTDSTTLRVTELYVEVNYTTPDLAVPDAVSDLATGTATESSMHLTWTAPGDDGNTGTAATYDIRYSTSVITDGNWASATQATGEPAPSIAGTSESFTVTGLNASTTYYFAIKTSDEFPNTSALSNVPNAATTSVPVTMTLHPSGAAAGDSVSYSGGAAAIALDTDDGDTSYGSSSGSSNDFYLEIDDTAQTGTINSVQVFVVARDPGMGTADFTIGLKTNGSNYFSGGESTLNSSYTAYSGDIYTTNPQTNSAWTWAEINNLVAIVNHTDSTTLRVTELYVAVNYNQ